jgi:hypothetical protein
MLIIPNNTPLNPLSRGEMVIPSGGGDLGVGQNKSKVLHTVD